MSLPKFDMSNSTSQKIFYSELKRQLDDIDKIENKKERSRKMSRLKIDVYNAIKSGKKAAESKKSFIRYLIQVVKQVIFNLINRIKRGI